MTEHVVERLEKTVRTSKGLREMLFDEMDLVRNGNSNPARARAIASLSNQVLQSVKLEIEMARYVHEKQRQKASDGAERRINAPEEIDM